MPQGIVGEENGAPVTLHHEDHGQGAPVVLIHGWPLSGRSWEAQVPALVGRATAWSPTTAGLRQLAQPWPGYDDDTFAADLGALLVQLDLTAVTLVGFSMGGGEVVRYLSRYGTGRVAKAVLAAAVPPCLYKSADNPDGGVNFLSAGGGGPLVSEPFRLRARNIAAFASPKGTLDRIAAFGRTDLRDELAAVTVPTLVIQGDADAIVPFEVSGKRSHEAIADSTLVVVEGGPHGINVTHAAEFNEAFLMFLAR